MCSDKELAAMYQPYIWRDVREPFPVRYMGYTVFRERGLSGSFRDLELVPPTGGCIVEYAVYYDYDIQHMYDLEHVWVAAEENGTVSGCWGTFHGMRMRIDRLGSFRWEGTHPLVYEEPGKHAFLPDPALFSLHDQFPECCREKAGGGLLVPDMLRGQMETDEETDALIGRYMRERFAFTPSMQYEREPAEPEKLIPWPELKARIPLLVREELARIRKETVPK